MQDQELQYIQDVSAIVNGDDSNAVNIIDELAKLDKPDAKEQSVMTASLIEYIENLEFEREDGELEGGMADDSYDQREQEIANNNLKNIKRIVSDVEKENWYKQVFWVEILYSNFQNPDHSYAKSVNHRLEATSIKDARKQKDEIYAAAPKQHPDDPDCTYEDVRINIEIVDSNGKRVERPSFFLN